MSRNYTPGAGEYRHDLTDLQMAARAVAFIVAVFAVAVVIAAVTR